MFDDVLLLDIGNTRLKWARLKDEAFLPGGEILHSGQLENEMLSQVAQDFSPAHVAAVSVVGKKNELLLREWGRREFQLEIEFVTAAQHVNGVISGYAEPTQMGSDRWAAMVAAHQQWEGNLCVIDAGTALTLDLLQQDGQHLGGYILPGLKMMQHCLLVGTEIPVSIDSVILASTSKVGDNTISCVANGAVQAACGLIERTMVQFEQEKKETIQCILTGGDSQYLADNLAISCVIEPDLVLRGVGYIVRSRMENT